MKSLLSYLRGQSGTATIEFALIFPAFVLVLLAAIESGVFMLRGVFLERGVDMAVRELRIGSSAPKNEDDLKELICNNAGFIGNCTDRLRLELVRVKTDDFYMPTTAATCVHRDELTQADLDYQVGSGHDLMMLRACAIFDPWFPSTGLGLRMPKDGTGAYSLIAASAFVVEPN